MLRTQTTSLVRRTLVQRSSAFVPAIAVRSNATQALSNPTLNNIEKRWEDMPPSDQGELWMNLRDRMKGNWHDLTIQEKKAAYWIAFGPHGPRAMDPPGEGTKVFLHTMGLITLSFAIFLGIRYFGSPPPHTMNKEWQEKSNEILKEQRSDPFTGLASEGYTGSGMVQSPPKNS